MRGSLTTVEHFYALDNRAAKGHFPGNPIIPGAVLLSDTLRAIEASLGKALTLSRVKAAKFHSPTRPGDRVLIEFGALIAGRLKFSCAVKGATVLTGEVLWDTTSCEATSTAN